MYLCTRIKAQMAESVDALVSTPSGATRAGSTPALGTSLKSQSLVSQMLARDFLSSGCQGVANNDRTLYFRSWGYLCLARSDDCGCEGLMTAIVRVSRLLFLWHKNRSRETLIFGLLGWLQLTYLFNFRKVQIDCVSEAVVRPARARVHSPGQRPG